MEKITDLKLTGLTLSGFKCFGEEQSFSFGDMTWITGSNHVGKSSIADAIAFAICGRTYSGEASLDRLYSEGEKSLRVCLGLLDEKGSAHELVRVRRNDKTSISFDGYDVRQKDLDLIFGESEVFLSIFNPAYFAEYLGGEGQVLLQKYLPLIGHEAVLEKLTDHQRALLEKESLLSPETYVGHRRERVKEYKEGIIALEGQKDLLLSQQQDGQKNLAMLDARKMDLFRQLETLREKREAGITTDLRRQYTDLLQRMDEAVTDEKQGHPDVSRLPQLEFQINLATGRLEKAASAMYESKYAGEMDKITAQLQLAREEHRGKSATLHHVRAGVDCPLCCRPITDDSLESVKVGIQKTMAAIVQDGIAKNEQLVELRELDKKARDVFEAFQQEDIQKHRDELAKLEKRRTEILSWDSGRELAELMAQRSQLEEDIDLGGLSPQDKTLMDSLGKELQQAESDYAAMKALLERPAPDLEKQKAELEALIRQEEDLISAALDYLGARNELTFQGLPLHKVAFSLYDVYKTTGEVKNVFRITYGGRAYQRLSRSEKVFAGMEVSGMIAYLTGRNYPVFVDDSECVVRFAGRPSGQVFLSRVAANTPLTVTAQEIQRQEPELKKAG